MSEHTILVIEDDPLNRKLVHALLSLGGYRVLEADNAEEGLALVRAAPPDCILMDIRLPGMDGLSATRILKQDVALRSIPVIALTAFAMGGDEQKAIEAGCDAYITKPIESARFMGAVRTLLQRTAPPAESGNGRVLIVDDEPAVSRFLSTQLFNAGWETAEASGGEEAIFRALENPPDLILMDVLMPGVDGYEATRRLKGDQRTAHVPIILVTGLSGVEDKLHGLEAGADEFLSKPVSTAELIVRIRNLITLRRYEEQLRHRGLADDLPAADGGGQEPTPGPARSARVLVFQQAASPQNDIKKHLDGLGYLVSVSGSIADQPFGGIEGPPDLVILDACLPGVDPLEICRWLKEGSATKHIPLVVIEGPRDPDTRIRYLTLGTDDLLPSPVDLRELGARVARLLRQKAHLDLLQSQYRSALVASTNDGLTGLFNNAYFKKFLDLEVKRSQRQNHPTSLVILDLDDFKSKNDTMGHTAGDMILSEVGRRIRKCIREIDLPARYGGEEFAVVLPYTDRRGAAVVAERIRAALASEAFRLDTRAPAVTVTASIGVATCPENGKLSGELIRAADARLYEAKRGGKNRVCGEGP